MSETNNTNENNANWNSLLEQILANSKNESIHENNIPQNNQNNSNTNNSNQPQNNQPNKNPSKSTKDFWRIFGAIFLAWIVFFSAFLWYIVFNPDQAQFFISLWIDPQDIKSLLEKLVNYAFWLLTWVLSIISLIFLFRAFVTKKEFAKKKTIATILSIFSIILLFWVISLWAWLVMTIWATDYINPNWWIIIRNNELKNTDKIKNWDEIMSNFNNLIWPITLHFDLSADARYASKYINLTSYNIDFDWDWTADKTWVNPENDQDIIFTYDKKWTYKPTWTYIWIDKVTKKEIEAQMEFPPINVIWVAKVVEKADRQWWKKITIDVSDLKNLWKMDFYLEDWNWKFTDRPDSSYNWGLIYAPLRSFNKESFICLAIRNSQKIANSCDKVFVVAQENQKFVDAEITAQRDLVNPLSYRFSINLTDWSVNPVWYEWIINNTIESEDEIFDKTFTQYWKVKIDLNLIEANWNKILLTKEVNINKPLSLSKPSWSITSDSPNSLLRVYDNNDNDLLKWNYNRESSEYRIRIWVPIEVSFDSSYIRVTDSLYEYQKTEWDFNWDWKFEKFWEKVSYNFLEAKKHSVIIRYTFFSKLRSDTQYIEERLVFEADKKEIDLKLDVLQDSDYAPTVVNFDASASQVKKWEIAKFSFDFWDGKWTIEWDAKQSYKYNFPWNYIVKLTATKDDWTEASITKVIILKEQTKNLQINSSVSSGFVWKTIDFDAAWTRWQIESYLWNFWDWTTSSEATPTHIYNNAWQYNIKLTITYVDWVIMKWEKSINIK